MIPWWSPKLGPLERDLVMKVLESNYINEGDWTTQFEQKVAALVGAKHGIGVTSGTAAIVVALLGVGVQPGDEVIVPDITFIATANAASLIGAKAVLCDIDPKTLNIDPAAFARAITGKTRALVPVHVSGRACDMKRILEVARTYGVAVVEDAAEGFLSKHKGRFLGTFGRAGCFSFSPNKTITTGQGGMIVTDDDKLAVRLRELKDQGRPVRGTGGDDVHASLGYNFKLTNLQAAVGVGQLSYLEERLARLKQTYRQYKQALTGLPGIEVLPFDVDAGESPQWVDVLVEKRNDLDAYLRQRDMHCRRFWFPIHTQAPYRLPDDGFPVSTRVGPHALWLPSAFTLTDADVEQVCAAIKKWA